ncbi:TRAP transporter substrate-binding protein [Virgibacillus siamensis]|uniref:TRAP transporter substrate-binding protein n=1 Tax=Virgibacillus siamensis TaxID=480071 RepID=UPI000984B16E|nr:TRAP transporter substrate-binding protein [Virgibacillus siamensis]
MRKNLAALFSVLIFAAVVLAACGGGSSEGASGESGDSEDTTVLRLAENQPEDYPTTIGAKKFAELVEKKTDGRYKVKVYAGGQLGEEKSVIEQVQLGSIDLARVNAVPLAEFSEEIGVLSMPFLFENEKQKWKKLNGEAGQELLGTLDGSNLVGLAFYDSGERKFYNSVRPIKTVEDMKGLKLRVQNSEIAIDVVEALGASATPMEYGEVYSAMQTGVIDGGENNFPSYYTANHYEVAKYFTNLGYQGVPEVLMASQSLWDKLSKEDKKAFREAALESVKVQREAWKDLVEESKAKVKKAGSKIIEVKDPSKWREAVQPVYDKYGDKYGKWIDKLTK